tara:strand:- start:20504 stop:20647 length:144 start_codon:yes stop_codon:yes gene_type:complete
MNKNTSFKYQNEFILNELIKICVQNPISNWMKDIFIYMDMQSDEILY